MHISLCMPMDKHSDGADIMDCTHPVLTGNMCECCKILPEGVCIKN
jgi:hypothetical protein